MDNHVHSALQRNEMNKNKTKHFTDIDAHLWYAVQASAIGMCKCAAVVLAVHDSLRSITDDLHEKT